MGGAGERNSAPGSGSSGAPPLLGGGDRPRAPGEPAGGVPTPPDPGRCRARRCRTEGRCNFYEARLEGLGGMRAELDRFWTRALANFKQIAEQSYREDASSE